MIGGKVIGLARGGGVSTLLHVEDDRRPGDRCSVRCFERRRDNGESVTIEIGDSVWWQSGDVMWTPQCSPRPRPVDGCGRSWDIHLPKDGQSH